jgi:hypothetical protein
MYTDRRKRQTSFHCEGLTATRHGREFSRQALTESQIFREGRLRFREPAHAFQQDAKVGVAPSQVLAVIGKFGLLDHQLLPESDGVPWTVRYTGGFLCCKEAIVMSQTLRGSSQREQFWQDAVAEWEKSGQSVRAFCRRRRLQEASFYGWRRTLRQREVMVQLHRGNHELLLPALASPGVDPRRLD